MIVAMMLPILASEPIMNDEYPFMFEVDNMDQLKYSAFAEISKTKEVPIIIYSMEPIETRMIQITESNCSLDLDTGESTEEVVASYVEQRDLYQYHVIEAGYPMKHKIFSYAAVDGNATYFINALQEEIAFLRAARTENENMRFIIADFTGDYRTDEMHWILSQWYTGVISAIDDNDNGWTWKQRYQHEVHRSVYDYATGDKWWTVEEGITTYMDSGDYKEDYANWVGPWVYKRENSIWNYDAEEWDHSPTSSVGTYSYDSSYTVKIGPTGPTLGFGAGGSSGGSQVTIDDVSTDTKIQWLEEFPPENGIPKPDYFWYPFAMDPPISASHNNYKTYRSSLFYDSYTSSFGFSWWSSSNVHYDAGFFFFFLLFFTMYSIGVLDQGIESYPATGS